MHRILKLNAGLAGLVMAFAMSASSASAVEHYSDSHCFKQASTVAYPEDQYATGELQDEEKVAAVEELTERHWQLRLSQMPIRQAQEALKNIDGDRWWYAHSVISLERARRFDERRSGSKFIYVTPEMKRLARERSEIRALKRKPCNPNMVYLGTR